MSQPADLLLYFDGLFLRGDMHLDGADLAVDHGLETACVVSLFSDRRAGATDELPAGETARRGFWGAAIPDRADDAGRFGSHLWLLCREKQTETTRLRAEQYAAEALEWMLEDGVASEVVVTASWRAPGSGWLDLEIVIYRPDGEPYRYAAAWRAVEERHAL